MVYKLVYGPGGSMGGRYSLERDGEEIGFIYDLSSEDAEALEALLNEKGTTNAQD